MSSGFRYQKYEFSFQDLKIWVQFSDTIVNSEFFCINAYVNVRNSISDFLDLKLCVQIPVIKNMSSVFGLENMSSVFRNNTQLSFFSQ